MPALDWKRQLLTQAACCDLCHCERVGDVIVANVRGPRRPGGSHGIEQRGRLWLKGLWWLYGPGGLFPRLLPHYLRYFKPGFHPWQHGDMRVYQRWTASFEDSGGDAIAAADAVMQDAPARAA